MKKLMGEQAAEILFNWYQQHAAQLSVDITSIDNPAEWIPVAVSLANHLALNPDEVLDKWPWQARALLAGQITGWMTVACSEQCAAQPLPVDKSSLKDNRMILRWLLKHQIAPMSVYTTD